MAQIYSQIRYLLFVLLLLIISSFFLFLDSLFLLFLLFLLFWRIWLGNVRVQLHFFTDCLVPMITPGAILLFGERKNI